VTGVPWTAAGFVVSDLDGCLLDAETYAFDAARPALRALAEAGCPLVLCSGKTRAEIEPLAAAMGLGAPFIVENGGAIVFPPGSFEGAVPGAVALPGAGDVVSLGAPRGALVQALREIADEAGVAVRGFADLDVSEVQALTGLPTDAARRALQREYDEPFLVDSPDAPGRLEAAAARRGLSVTHGGRFHHLMGGSDKGLAVRTLRAVYALGGRGGACVGLGDAETDLPLLRAVDRPIVVPARDGRVAALLARELDAAELAPAPGPEGWNAALLTVLAGGTLPRVRETAREEA
jgi:mannosyl-3-phosphoglycerate phosphatase